MRVGVQAPVEHNLLPAPSSPIVLIPRRARAIEPRRRHNTLTQIMIRRRIIHDIHQLHPLNHQPRARARRAALELGHDVADRGAGPVAQRQVADVELARVAVARRGVVARALRQREHARRVAQREVRQRDVGREAQPAAAAVGRGPGAGAGPGLDVGAVAHRGVDGDVAHRDVLDGLEDAVCGVGVLVSLWAGRWRKRGAE